MAGVAQGRPDAAQPPELGADSGLDPWASGRVLQAAAQAQSAGNSQHQSAAPSTKANAAEAVSDSTSPAPASECQGVVSLPPLSARRLRCSTPGTASTQPSQEAGSASSQQSWDSDAEADKAPTTPLTAQEARELQAATAARPMALGLSRRASLRLVSSVLPDASLGDRCALISSASAVVLSSCSMAATSSCLPAAAGKCLTRAVMLQAGHRAAPRRALPAPEPGGCQPPDIQKAGAAGTQAGVAWTECHAAPAQVHP